MRSTVTREIGTNMRLNIIPDDSLEKLIIMQLCGEEMRKQWNIQEEYHPELLLEVCICLCVACDCIIVTICNYTMILYTNYINGCIVTVYIIRISSFVCECKYITNHYISYIFILPFLLLFLPICI